ncbi:MAG: lasso RiPP family leader peptide-containing protein [Candidatus Binatia bacterium]
MTEFKEKAHRKMRKRNQEEKKQKNPYSSPRLIEYGDVQKLTQGSSGPKGDGGGTKRP